MYKITALNKISAAGLSRLSDAYTLTDDLAAASGILVRSHDMLDMAFPDTLLAIARAGAGVNNIPIARCSEEGIVVFNTPGANANAVNELVIAAMLLAARNLPDALDWTKTLTTDVASAVEKGKSRFAGSELQGKTLGIIGLGAIGVLVANTAEKLGMRVIGHDPFITVRAAHKLSNNADMAKKLDALLPQCDYLTLHVPSIESTKGMIDKAQFAQMKKGVCLLNFSRGDLVNHGDLFDAINAGVVGRYITDFPEDDLLGKAGVVCLPHLGASTAEAEEYCALMAVNQLMDYLENGNITNSVNFPKTNLGAFDHTAAVCRVCILNKNIPAMLRRITSVFEDINICDMINKSKGDYACTIIDVDSEVDDEALKKLLALDGIVSVRIIR